MRWLERVWTWIDEHPLVVDSVLATGALLVLVPASVPVTLGTLDTTPATGWTIVAFGTGMCVALAFRRTHPTRSAATVFALGLLHVLLGMFLVVPADLLVLVALYSVTTHGPTWAYRTAIGSAFAGILLVTVLHAFAYPGDPVLWFTIGFVMSLMALVTFAFGLVRRARRTTVDALRERARRLEVEHEQLARIATAAERARIAREMHDIVAHSLSVIIAQADGGRYAAAHDPTAAERALGTIGETGRAALADMRRLLGVLREETGDAAGPSATRTPSGADEFRPQPGAQDLDQLVTQMRASGMAVSLVRMGTPRTLPPGTGLAVYRIAQESLTNVLKHAGPDVHVTMVVRWAPDALVLEISDDGRGAAADSDGLGQGLLGMRERAAMLGGTLTAGPRAGGGYRVRATIPLPHQSAGAVGAPTGTGTTHQQETS